MKFNPFSAWLQAPLANKSVGGVSGNVTGSVGSVTTVSDKTGYSLTAGSYVVRASSTQHGVTTLAAGSDTSINSTISSVTTSRAVIKRLGQSNPTNTSTYQSNHRFRVSITGATTVNTTRTVAIDAGLTSIAWSVLELF